MKDNVLNDVLDWLEEEVHSLKEEINVRTETVNSLEKITSGLKEYDNFSEYKEKYEDISEEYEKEKNRLIKLHDHYRSIEGECNNLKKEVKGWQDWFNSNKDIYERLFSAAPPKNTSEVDEKPHISFPEPVKKKSKTKKKKK